MQSWDLKPQKSSLSPSLGRGLRFASGSTGFGRARRQSGGDPVPSVTCWLQLRREACAWEAAAGASATWTAPAFCSFFHENIRNGSTCLSLARLSPAALGGGRAKPAGGINGRPGAVSLLEPSKLSQPSEPVQGPQGSQCLTDAGPCWHTHAHVHPLPLTSALLLS